MLIEGGVDELSIRKVSDRCGYTAPTLYHHFGDKQGLIVALLEEHFGLLLGRMLAIPHDGDPARHLRSMAEAFLSFALEHPGHYQLLMAPSEGDPVPSAEAARELVRDDLESLRKTGDLATDDLDAAFDVLWAMLHGVISLQLGPRPGEAGGSLTKLALDAVEAGLLLKGRTTR